MEWTHHKLCNPVVALMGDRASAKADVVVNTEGLGGEGRREHLTIGGWASSPLCNRRCNAC
jgi:hypothetical protein